MVKYIKRTTDNKFLQSLENDLWVDDIKNSTMLSYNECDTILTELLQVYKEEEIKEVVDFSKSKEITNQEKKELISLLRKK